MNWDYKNYKISVDINGMFTFNDGKQDIKCPTLAESKARVDNLCKMQFYQELIDFLDTLNPESFAYSSFGFGGCNELHKYITLFPALDYECFHKKPEFYTFDCSTQNSRDKRKFLVISTEVHDSATVSKFKGVLINEENMAKIVDFLESSLKKYNVKPALSSLEIVNKMDKIISIVPTDFHNKVLVKGIEKGRMIKVLADVTQLGELGKGIY